MRTAASMSITLLLAALAGCSRNASPAVTEEHLETQRKLTAEAVDRYAPQTAWQPDDLGTSLPDLLRQLPGVAEVETLVSPRQVTGRIIHLRDYHHVPRELF